ncbi:hypothetical protein GCM10007916_19800 [Psychromonas marina]|uniref:HTH crp-type domain-containing protein n=1 Tax=Psychromonas marina TaxID=88364 RepID=A0ABQ6E182_9GAMM|nr:Crp/Fnr family transcriptional regulator [Psychromonas marina]GLS90913.1 hypothetical protein GCM10007916_19800 [Psychromonas marina]
MSTLNIDTIQWPGPISEGLKQQLFEIAQPGKGLPDTQKKTDFPGIYYITAGLATLSVQSENMNNSLGFVLGTNDWVGANTVGKLSDIFLLTVEIEPVEYLFLCRKKVTLLAEKNLEVYKFLFHCLNKMQPVFWQVSLTALHDKEARIVYTLVSLAQKKKIIQGTKVSIKITQEQLCAVTGLSRPRINEVLKKIEKAHEISIERGVIHILDTDALGKRLNQLNMMFNDPR